MESGEKVKWARLRRAVRGVSRMSLGILAALALAGGAKGVAREPAPIDLAGDVQPLGIPGLRQWGDELSRASVDQIIAAQAPFPRQRFGAELAAGRTPTLDFLALSGGGQWGAFGAGILTAWSESGTRPKFQGVSGVSTGAIIAPFAFVGPRCDATLREIHSSYSTDDLLEPTLFSGVLSGTALADTGRLRAMIARCATADLLDEIAVEHRKGRLLRVGATNLDAGRPVIWDVGAIAASGAPGALDLVRALILASAAIPVAFPPVFVAVEAPDGRVFDEMHVDGGASSQVTFPSPDVPMAEATRRILGRDLNRRVRVIVNDDLVPRGRMLRPRITAIGGAAVSSLIRGSAVGDVHRLHAIAERDSIEMNVTWIPSAIPCPEPTEDFDRVFMTCLFDAAGDLFRGGRLWRDTPPFFVRRLEDLEGSS